MCDHPNREEAMTVVRRDMNGKATGWCDPCLVPLIRALNTNGLATIASCCGHGTHRPSVALADGRWVVVYDDADFRAADTTSRPVNDDGTWVPDEDTYAVVGGVRCRVERMRRTVCGMGYEARFVPVAPEGDEVRSDG